MSESDLTFEDVTFAHGETRVLDAVSATVTAGKTTALLGPSGSGKSTLLRVALGLAAPLSGTVRLGDRVLSQPGRVVVAPEDRGLAVVFQDLALYPHLSVRRNLAFGLEAQGVSAAEREARIARMLSCVGLSDKATRLPSQLSGGERQRVAIARALVLEPRAVMLDEPLSNLDIQRRRELLALFRALFEEANVTALWVTHDLREAAAIADRALVLEEGRITQCGTIDELRSGPATDFVRALARD